MASPEEFFTPSPTKSTQHPLAAVIKRAKQIECEKAKQAAAAAAAAAQTTSPVILRAGKPVQIEVKLQQPPVAGSGNRTVIIGSSKLHCEPPPHDRNRPNMAMDLRGKLKPTGSKLLGSVLSDGDDEVSDPEEHSRNSVLRHHSYRTAVRSSSVPLCKCGPLEINKKKGGTTNRINNLPNNYPAWFLLCFLIFCCFIY